MAKRSKKSGKRAWKERGRGDSTKAERRDIEIADTADKAISSDNDIKWWTKYQQLVKDVGSVYTSYAVGAPFTLFNGNSPSLTVKTTIPGIMVLRFIPAYGCAVSATDPINIAARNIYSYIRHANSGSKNYDAPDLIMYLMGMDNAFAFHAFCRRIYGIARTYAPTNRYYSDKLLIACGMDPDDVYENGAQLRYAINLMAVKLGSLCVPSSMDIFQRHSWMSEGLYLDSNTRKAQTYMFVPEGMWKINVTGDEGTALQYVNFPGDSQMTVADLIDYFNDLIAPIWGNEDFNIMSGDILKAYGDDGVVRLFTIPEDYAVLPAYSQEVLTEIENAISTPFDFTATSTTGFAITQNPNVEEGYVSFNPQFSASYNLYLGEADDDWMSPGFAINYLSGDTVMNFHMDNPGPELFMVASRLHNTIGFNSSTSKAFFSSLGTEIVTHILMYVITPDGMSKVVSGGVLGHEITPTMFPRTTSSSTVTTAIEAAQEGCQALACLMNFDWHPLVITGYTASGQTQIPLVAGDIDVYTLVSQNVCFALHEVALLSVFDVPQKALIK